MATLSISIPDDQAARVRNSFCAQYGYQETINGEPNPETKAQFMKQKIIQFVKESIKAHERQAASETAGQQAAEAVESEVTLT